MHIHSTIFTVILGIHKFGLAKPKIVHSKSFRLF